MTYWLLGLIPPYDLGEPLLRKKARAKGRLRDGSQNKESERKRHSRRGLGMSNFLVRIAIRKR